MIIYLEHVAVLTDQSDQNHGWLQYSDSVSYGNLEMEITQKLFKIQVNRLQYNLCVMPSLGSIKVKFMAYVTKTNKPTQTHVSFQ